VGLPQNNVIPSSADVVVDVRLVPGVTHRTALGALTRLARTVRARWPEIEITVTLMEPPRPATRTRRSAAIAVAMTWAVTAVTGRAPRWGGVPGSTDGTIFVVERRVPIVTFGPGKREMPHQVDEYVEVRELLEAARCYAAAAVRFLGATA
jgi:succinyl-diaminopimelate desuccinylase